MKSAKRLSKYTSILLSMLLMLSAMSPGLTALAQERANAAPTVLTYKDDSITAELKAGEGASLPAGAALTVKALNKDSQDEAEKALYAQTEAGLNAKASEQGTTVESFTAYSITLTQNGQDVTPEEGAFKLKLTDKNAAAPEAYKQSQDGQKSVELYQETEAKDEQNNPVSTMEPKPENEASINADPDGNVTEVETTLTTLKPVAMAWQSPQTQTGEEAIALSAQALADNQFSYQFEVNERVDASNLVIDFKENNYNQGDLNIRKLLNEETSGIKEVTSGKEIPIKEFMPEGLSGYRLLKATLIGPGGIMYDNITSVTVKTNGKGGIESYSYKVQSRPGRPVTVNVSDASQYTLYFACQEDLKTIPTIDSASKGVEIQMFDYDGSLPDWGSWGHAGKGQLDQGLLKKTLTTNAAGEKIPERADNQRTLSENFSTNENPNYKGTANHLFSEAAYKADGTFSYSSFDNYAFLDQTKKDEKGNSKFTVYQALGTPVDYDTAFCFQRGNFFPYNKIDKAAVSQNKNLYDENGTPLPDKSADPTSRKGETLYRTLNAEDSDYGVDYYFGMVVTANFIQQKDGKYNNQNMVYNFNGDDDMWVFIDDVLVLDLGGVHDAQSGSIDFATGKVTWSNNKSNGNVITEAKGESTIRQQFKDAKSENAVEWNNNGDGSTFANYTGHEIKIFYMERGAGASNCKMQFNLPTVPKDSISVTKEVTNVNEGAYTDVDFDFKLYVQDNDAKEGDTNTIKGTDGKIYRLKTYQPYDLKEGTEIVPGTEGSKTNDDGIFTLKHGQTAYFKEIAEQGKKYIVQEVGVDQNQYDTFKVNGEAVSASGSSISGTTNDGKIVQTKPLTVGTDAVVKMQNHCDGQNHHTINITKQIDGGQASDDNFTAQVTIGGKPYTGKYKVAAKDAAENVWESAKEQTAEDGSVQLKASQTIRIENIAAGTRFEVTETGYNETNYKTPTYTVNKDSAVEIGTDQSKASGKVAFKQNPQITITNHPNVNEDSLQISKTAKVADWNSRTYTLTLTAKSTTGSLSGATVQDTIDPRFDVVDESGNRLADNAAVEGGTLRIEDSRVYIYWENQTLGTEEGSWTKNIHLKAKEDYVGGNNVPTNVAGDDQSFVTASGITKAFPQPKVNVKDILKLSNVTNTVFYGDKLSDGDITMLQSTMNKNNQLKDMDESGAYSPIQPGQLTVHWYSTLGENDALSGGITDLKGDLADKLANPQTETPHTCYLQITYPMAASTDESAENTNKNIAGTAAIGQSGLATASNDGQTAVNGTTPAETAEMNGKPYGVYTNNIIKGQLEITKTIDQPYTNIKQINANQTFVFKIERYEVDGDGNKGKLAETFYETINFNANETETEKTKLISGLKKGYYTVTEETNWSQKYELKTTTDNYDKNNNSNGQEAVDLLIGDRLKEATQDNPKPEFYGLDETVLHDSDGEKLPENQQYSHFAEGSKATVKFTNNLSTTWKWLSDTAAAVNVFDKTAQ